MGNPTKTKHTALETSVSDFYGLIKVTLPNTISYSFVLVFYLSQFSSYFISNLGNF